MIELSKCPNCKSEDRVTIAGKEFCMSCGTPSDAVDSSNSNNAAQGAAQSTTSQSTNASDTPTPDQSLQGGIIDSNQDANQSAINSTSSVSKFSNTENPSLSLNDSTVAATNDPPSANFASSQQADPQAAEIPKLVLPNPSLSTQASPSNVAGIIPQAAQIASNVYPVEGQSAIGTTRTIPSPLHGDIGLDTKNPSVMTDDQLHALQNSVNSTQEMPQSAIADNSSIPSQSGNIALSSSFSPSGSMPAESTSSAGNDSGKPTAQIDHFKSDTGSGLKKSKIKNPLSGDIKSKVKPAAVAASIVAMFLVGAYIWSTNYPNLAFKIASAKSGITASMPGYVPAGFNLTGDIMTNPGAVSYNLIDQTKSKKISISQSKTDWDSQALAENYVAPKADNYTALNAQGITIYVLGNSQASWINKGTWYKIESSDGVLNQDQIIKIATSL